MNILIKLMSIVSLVIAPYIAQPTAEENNETGVYHCTVNGKEYTCNSQSQCDSTKAANTHDIAEIKGAFLVDNSHSSVSFDVKHIITNVSGSVRVDSGYVNFENSNGPKMFVQMDMASLTTQNSYRDEHLRTKEGFFEVAKFPKASFVANEIKATEDNGKHAYQAIGKLTLHGVTRDLTVFFNYGGNSEMEYDGKKMLYIGFEGEAVINRQDYGITASQAGNEVTIHITLEASH